MVLLSGGRMVDEALAVSESVWATVDSELAPSAAAAPAVRKWRRDCILVLSVCFEMLRVSKRSTEHFAIFWWWIGKTLAQLRCCHCFTLRGPMSVGSPGIFGGLRLRVRARLGEGLVGKVSLYADQRS